jgi:hypothetical protein
MRRWLAVASWGGSAFVSFAGLPGASSRAHLMAAFFVGLSFASCRRPGDEGSGTDGAAVSTAASNADSSAGPGVPLAEVDPAALPLASGALVAATRRACRVMSLRGEARLASPWQGTSRPGAESAPAPASRWLKMGELVPDGGIISLGTGGTLTVQATVSTREMTIVGPAIAEACPGGDEAVRLSRGKATSFPGAGVRPGAEVWVATPLGVVRFNDAQIEIDVLGADAEGLRVTVVTGQAIVVPASGVTIGPAGELDAGRSAEPLAGPTGVAGAKGTSEGLLALSPGTILEASRPKATPARWLRDLANACARRALAAREAGQKVATGARSNRASLADLAAAHVQARQLARAACESARAAGVMPTGQYDPAVRTDLDRADESWKAVPPTSASARAASSSAPALSTRD